jgi:hypothetical protein
MPISQYLGVGAVVTVKATNLKPTTPLRNHFGNDYETAKVSNLVVIGLCHDSAGKVVGVEVASSAFKDATTQAEIVFKCKCGCATVTTHAPEGSRIEVGLAKSFRWRRVLNVSFAACSPT